MKRAQQFETREQLIQSIADDVRPLSERQDLAEELLAGMWAENEWGGSVA